MTDLMDRLRAADPVREEPLAPPLEPLLARLEAKPPAGRRAAARQGPLAARRRRAGRPRALIPAFAAVLVLALAVVFARGGDPDVVAEAREALATSGEVVHIVTRLDDAPTLLVPYVENGRRVTGTASKRVESWVALDPVRSRTRMTILPRGSGAPRTTEFDTADGVTRFAQSWDDKLLVMRLPARARRDIERLKLTPSPLRLGPDPLVSIRELLASGGLKPAGETTFEGRRVLRLRGSEPLGGTKRRPRPRLEVEYLVDAETYAPVRMTMRSTVDDTVMRRTFEVYERLPATPANLALLRIPDADQRRVVTE